MGSQRVRHGLETKQQQHEANCKVGGQEGQVFGFFFFSFIRCLNIEEISFWVCWGFILL